jgi:hypothetical protein
MHALHAAKKKTAEQMVQYMTSDLRNRATEAGWDKDVADSISVKFNGKEYAVHIPAEHADRAFFHEYGSETSAPTAVLRKYSEDKSTIKVYEKLLDMNFRRFS